VTVVGRLVDDSGVPLVGWLVRAEDERDWAYSLAATKTGDDGRFVLESSTTLPLGAEPQLTFYVSDGDRPVRVLEPLLVWRRGGAAVELVVSAPPPPVFYLYGRVWNPATESGVGGLTVVAVDRGGSFDAQSVETGDTGLFEIWWPDKGGPQPDPELRALGPGEGAVPSQAPSVEWEATRATQVPIELVWDVAGVVVDRATGAGVPGAVVEAWDAVEVWLAGANTNAAGEFTLHVPRRSGQVTPPQPIFRVYRDGQPAGTITTPVPWDDAGFATVQLQIGTDADAGPTNYRIAGTAIDRATRRGAPGLRVEAWAADLSFLLGVADTAGDGRFAVTFQSDTGEEAPQPRFRFYRGGQLVAQPDVPVLWRGGEATVFVEVDVPPEPPRSFRIAGRVIDKRERGGLSELRVEAWDKAPRDGGALGVAAVTGSDGTFELLLPGRHEETISPGPAAPRPPLDTIRRPTGALAPIHRRPIPMDGAAPPAVFMRVYGRERLLATISPEISWTPEGIGTTVLEMAAPAATSQEVGLHELGESVASTVDRVQTELSRYPKTMGAYVLDEIDLNLPVEMRVDEVGQVRTKVVDAATPEKNVGQVRMKVRPVLGATEPATEVRDQPLAVLEELTPDAIARLEAQRIYSVEDLARAASSAAGRAALGALSLGVDLDALLAKAALLAFRPLPRAIREALVRLGVTSLAAFSKDANPASLAERLSGLLEQTFSASDVEAWQASVKAAFAVPRPSDETPAPSELEADDEH
jgi:hypothetical protein